MQTLAGTYLAGLSRLSTQPVFLVGGSVRDLLIGLPEIKDIDILIPTGSEIIARSFSEEIDGSFFFLDEERKIMRVVKRSDAGVFQFDFTDFIGADLQADLGRRDFTVNAMAIDLRDFLTRGARAAVVDLFNGRSDAGNKIIRTVRPEAFNEDPLRLLRAVRFAATLGFTIEEETAAQIRSRAALITRPSPERIRDEFFQILAGRGADKYLALMDGLGLLQHLVPELDSLRGFAPGMYHAYDVLIHSLKAVEHVDGVLDDLRALSPQHASRVLEHLEEQFEQFIPRKAALRFACLLHDIAKPETFSRDQQGHIHFYGHDNQGAEKARETCDRFRLSRDTAAAVTKTIKQHMRLFNLSTPGGPGKNAMYRYCRDLGDALPESLVLAQADARATYDIMPREKFLDTEKPMIAVLDYYYEKFLKADARPLVTGQDLIDRGMQPGPRFREILEDIKERQAAGLLRDRDEALAFIQNLQKREL